MSQIIIAIDGFSSTGKSTIAKAIAKQLQYVYVDTGAMYRAVTLFAIQNKMTNNKTVNKDALVNKLESIQINFNFNDNLGYAEVYLNGINVEASIRTLEVSSYVSQVSTISEVRKKLVEQQQLMGKDKGIVMDGRDIGTVVFPEAELKLFMTASDEIRAQRRYEELIERGDHVSYEEVFKNVTTRDKIDSSRKDSPLIKAKDAVEVDNSSLTINEQLKLILNLIEDKLS